MTTKNQVAETKDNSENLPAYLKGLSDSERFNDDNFDQSDVVVPRVKLSQALSEEVEAFEDAKAGTFWHTGFDINLGSEFEFVICARKKKYMLVAPLEDGQGILHGS